MDTHVGLNVATRVCDLYPDKCLFAVLCRFWLQCSHTLKLCADYRLTLMQPTQATLTAAALRLAHLVALGHWRAFTWLAGTTSVVTPTPRQVDRPGGKLGGFQRLYFFCSKLALPIFHNRWQECNQSIRLELNDLNLAYNVFITDILFEEVV